MISIITCIFNQSIDYFRACVRSVHRQQGPLEWIIVDDYSDPVLAGEYAGVLRAECMPHRVFVIRLEENAGLSIARNAGLCLANGDWVIVLDSDDLLAPNLCKNVRMQCDSTQLLCVDVEYFNDLTAEYRSIGTWEQKYRKYGKTTLDPFLWFDFYYHGIIARRGLLQKLGGYDRTLRVGEDQDILLRATEAIPIDAVGFLSDLGYRYRNNTNGVCSTQWKEVERNYAKTMVAAARRRGAGFDDCRCVGPALIDGALVDQYQYLDNSGWLSWGDLADRIL